MAAVNGWGGQVGLQWVSAVAVLMSKRCSVEVKATRALMCRGPGQVSTWVYGGLVSGCVRAVIDEGGHTDSFEAFEGTVMQHTLMLLVAAARHLKP